MNRFEMFITQNVEAAITQKATLSFIIVLRNIVP